MTRDLLKRGRPCGEVLLSAAQVPGWVGQGCTRPHSALRELPNSGGYWLEALRVPTPAALLGTGLVEMEVPRAPCLCPCSLMDDCLPLLTLPRFPTLCLGSCSFLFLACPSHHLHLSTPHLVFGGLAETLPSPQSSPPCSDSAFRPSRSEAPPPFLCPLSGMEHLLPCFGVF